ncbi:type II toxin-antitoxin system VapC family toxin [Methylomagnum ishizawai]|uniref:type II toxin-antitoxin system VapC family toxin n=1 Tax=Methylomagnum ishizawai TaxID=1760988 RepID=UPI001C33BF83|nr:type II toxin-antitoxin system VapC family toxin [Methylomagnum ishizawai]BBL76915.1 ribonuclease VapC [Methylomagnum ishizawai]
MIMLDTNICVYVLKKHPLYLLEKFNQAGEIHLSVIVYAELCSGVTLSPTHLQPARQHQLQEFAALTTLHEWDEQAAVCYAQIRADLKMKGTPIGNMDMLIAAHALSLDATLITNNLREFERVQNLMLENWLTSESVDD